MLHWVENRQMEFLVAQEQQIGRTQGVWRLPSTQPGLN